jgi:hypothetical protein
MCPVRDVTYVSGRSSLFLGSCLIARGYTKGYTDKDA